ncbi:hypothetical protein [Thermogymnomonas acidicola]|uniref:hypothetical protein n=1 Tax=Thermogymnomonas acidicola TaxID=399579 RepID=UPI001493DF1A|nr:hypothetical protein [Thermogymnomonas acidicola]
MRAERMELRGGETLTVGGLGRYGSFLILPQGRGSALASYPSHRYLLPLRMVQVEPQVPGLRVRARWRSRTSPCSYSAGGEGNTC